MSERTKRIVKIIVSFILGGIVTYLVIELGIIRNIEIVLSNYKSIVDTLGVIISGSAIVSIYWLIKQIKFSHEKARREKTIDMLMMWSTSLTPETNFAVKIVEKFDRDQCGNLYKMEQFKVSKELYQEIESVYTTNDDNGSAFFVYLKKVLELGQYDVNTKSELRGKQIDEVDLDKHYIKKLRFSIIQYLNLIETILTGWQNGILDRDIIEQQFAYLYDPSNNKNCLQDFRIASGSENSYPNIEAFFIQLEKNRKKKITSKGYVV